MNADLKNLTNKSKKDLIELVKKLAEENAVLKDVQKFMETSNKRIEKLEREQNQTLQYMRRDSIEISGIPDSVSQKDLKAEVVKIYETAGVTVHGKKLAPKHIQACHRIGQKGIAIVKFANRKFAREGLVCGRNLKDKQIYDGSKVYLNTSFCPAYKHFNFVLRSAKKKGDITHWKVRNGVNMVQLEENGDYFDITHISDLVEHGLLEADSE